MNNPAQKNEALDLELSKILAKIMQSSYKKKEVGECIDRIIKKLENKVINRYDDVAIKSLRLEFEEIRKNLYGI